MTTDRRASSARSPSRRSHNPMTRDNYGAGSIHPPRTKAPLGPKTQHATETGEALLDLARPTVRADLGLLFEEAQAGRLRNPCRRSGISDRTMP